MSESPLLEPVNSPSRPIGAGDGSKDRSFVAKARDSNAVVGHRQQSFLLTESSGDVQSWLRVDVQRKTKSATAWLQASAHSTLMA